MSVVQNYCLDRRVFNKAHLTANRNTTFTEPECTSPYRFSRFSCHFLVFHFVSFWLHSFQTTFCSAYLGNTFQQGVSIFWCHSVELFLPFLSIKCFNGSQVGVQHIYEFMQLLVGKSAAHLVDGICPERKRNSFAPVELREPLFKVARISNLYEIWERWVGQYVNDTFLAFHIYFFLKVNNLSR